MRSADPFAGFIKQRCGHNRQRSTLANKVEQDKIVFLTQAWVKTSANVIQRAEQRGNPKQARVQARSIQYPNRTRQQG